MQLFERFRRRARGSSAPDPGSPHRFRPLNDPGMAAAGGGSGTITGGALEG